MAAFILWRYGLDRVTRIVTLILVNLAIFQLAEFMICEGALGLTGEQWARLGYVAITLLPPLGIHLGLQLSGKKSKPLLAAAYGSGAILSGLFLFSPQGMYDAACLGNYVIFQYEPWIGRLHTIYYFGWLLVGSGLAWNFAQKTRKKHARRALYGLAIGYAAFIIPTVVVSLISPETRAGIPSIMCGFAVLLAFILTFWVIPEYKRYGKRSTCISPRKVQS